MGNRRTIIVILISLTMVFPAVLLAASTNVNAAPATGWSTTVVDNSKRWDITDNSTVKVDLAGHIHIAFISHSRLWYATNKTGSWNVAELDAATIFPKFSPSMAVDASNNVFISYAVRTIDGGDHWIINLATVPAIGAAVIENVSNTSAGQFSAIAIDAAGSVHVFYAEAPTVDLLEKVRSPAGSWAALVVLKDQLPGHADNINVIITPSGATYLVYLGNLNEIDFAVRAALTGEFTFGTAVILSGGLDQYGAISLALDSSGNMNIAFTDKARHMVEYANSTGATAGLAWNNIVDVAPDNIGNGKYFETAVVISAGVANVIYKKDFSLHMDPFNMATGAFTVASPIESGTSARSYGGMISAAVSSEGHVYIAYTGWDPTLGDITALRMDVNMILPGAPQTLGEVPGDHQVSLNWGAASPRGGPSVLFYNIYRSTSTGTEIIVNHTNGPLLTFVDTDVNNFIPYFYRVAAVSANGEGAKTDELTVTLKTPPSAPGNMTISNPEYKRVHLSWTASDTFGGDAISAYYVYRSTIAGNEAFLNKTISGTALSYDDLTVANGQNYYYRVSGANTVGFSPNATEMNITPYWTPSAPGFLAIAGNGQAFLSWTGPTDQGGYAAIGNYSLYFGSSPTMTLMETVSGNVTTYTKAGLTNGQAYFFAVAGLNPSGEGIRSFANVTPSSTPLAPGAPAGLVATGGSGQVVLTWNTPSNSGTQVISEYKIYRGGSAGGLSYLGKTGSNSLTYIDAGLMNGLTFYYAVVAVNSVGDSTKSIAANASTLTTSPSGAPEEVSEVNVVPNDNSVAVRWTAPDQGSSPITHYYVYRAETNDTSQALLIANLNGSALSFQDTSAVNGKTYYYWVMTSNSLGASNAARSQAVSPAAKGGDSLLPIIGVMLVMVLVIVLVLFLFLRKKKVTPAAPPSAAFGYDQPAQPQYQQQPSSGSVNCPKCGTPLSSDFAVCPSCGNRLR